MLKTYTAGGGVLIRCEGDVIVGGDWEENAVLGDDGDDKTRVEERELSY